MFTYHYKKSRFYNFKMNFVFGNVKIRNISLIFFFSDLQPKSDVDLKARKGKEINIDNFKNFHARRRWKHSMKVVSLCNKLSRSKQKLGLETDSAEIVVQPETVVSNNTTGKTAEVSKH